jgi:uncharacterized coiled-coil DUF342 family protein
MNSEQIFKKMDELRAERNLVDKKLDQAQDKVLEWEDKANEWQRKIDHLNHEILNLATDLWGGAGPDCKIGRDRVSLAEVN